MIKLEIKPTDWYYTSHTPPRDELRRQINTTYARYDLRNTGPYDYELRYPDPPPLYKHSHFAMLITANHRIEYMSREGIAIVSRDDGTHWNSRRAVLTVHCVEQGEIATGNIGIVVSEEDCRSIEEAVSEYNRWRQASRPPTNRYERDREYLRRTGRLYEDIDYERLLRKIIEPPEKLPDINTNVIDDNMFKIE
jgi:hypothetical protein